MAKKNGFFNWVGYKEETEPSMSSVDRIRELEAQLADLRSRRDIRSLSREEFEILATETAVAMIKSAQIRESKAQAASDRLVNETSRAAKDALEAAQNKAQSILSGAESRGRKYIQAAESEAEEMIANAEDAAERGRNTDGAIRIGAERERHEGAAERPDPRLPVIEPHRLVRRAARNAMDAGERTMWIFEPSVAEQVFEVTGLDRVLLCPA